MIVDEMDMTLLQVRYSWGKFLTQTQSGTPSTIIYTRWSVAGMRDLDVMLLWSGSLDNTKPTFGIFIKIGKTID